MNGFAQHTRPLIAKLTAPKPERVVARERLFRALDEAPGIAWIAAPAGAGKSTLVASWLEARKVDCLWYRFDSGDSDPAAFFAYLGEAATAIAPESGYRLPALKPEYCLGLDTYVRNFFRRLCTEFAPLSCLVLDDYHELPENARLHALIRQGLEEIPAGFRVIVVSRGEAPPEYARLRAGGQMAALGWRDLRLTAEEASAVLEKRGGSNSPAAAAARNLYEHCDGWVAGLILMLEHLGDSGAATDVPLVFDYFAAEVLARLDETNRRFLICTALLPVVRVDSAAALTGVADAGDILAILARRGFFVSRCREAAADRYEYHPLLRSFLLASGNRNLGQEAWRRMKGQAAQVLAKEGESEAAIALLAEIGDWSKMVRVVVAVAPALLSQGRHQTLRSWLEALPEPLYGEVPWLEYFAAQCELSIAPTRARPRFERAYAGFVGGGDVLGQHTAWASIGLCFTMGYYHLAEADRWIDELECLRARHSDLPPNVEIQVLSAAVGLVPLRRPDFPDLEEMAARLENLAAECLDLSTRLLAATQLIAYWMYYRGDRAHAQSLIARFEPGVGAGQSVPLAYQFWNVWCIYHAWFGGDIEAHRQALDRARETGRASGVPIGAYQFRLHQVLDPADGSCWDDAERALDACRPPLDATPHHVELYHFVRLWLADARGDRMGMRHAVREFARASAHNGSLTSEAFLALVSGMGCYAEGRTEDLWPALDAAREAAKRCGAVIPLWDALFVRAELARRLCAATDLEAPLREFFEIGAHRTLVRGYATHWNRPALAQLCVLALERNIEPDYVRALVRRRRLAPEIPPTHLDGWPWSVRVRTFGRFEILIEDKPLVFTASRVPVKPFELLKALIASGGSEVPLNELADMLWPESHGDAARRAFLTNLDRLRRLIGKESIILREGRVSLDPGRVWTDLAAMEEDAKCLRSPLTVASQALAGFADQALARYAGAFLPHEEMLSWLPDAQRRIGKRRAGFFTELARHCHLARDAERLARCREAVAG